MFPLCAQKHTILCTLALLQRLLQFHGALAIIVILMMNFWLYSPSERNGSAACNLCKEYWAVLSSKKDYSAILSINLIFTALDLEPIINDSVGSKWKSCSELTNDQKSYWGDDADGITFISKLALIRGSQHLRCTNWDNKKRKSNFDLLISCKSWGR